MYSSTIGTNDFLWNQRASLDFLSNIKQIISNIISNTFICGRTSGFRKSVFQLDHGRKSVWKPAPWFKKCAWMQYKTKTILNPKGASLELSVLYQAPSQLEDRGMRPIYGWHWRNDMVSGSWLTRITMWSDRRLITRGVLHGSVLGLLLSIKCNWRVFPSCGTAIQDELNTSKITMRSDRSVKNKGVLQGSVLGLVLLLYLNRIDEFFPLVGLQYKTKTILITKSSSV